MIKSLNTICDQQLKEGESEIVLPPGQYAVEETIVRSGPFSICGAGTGHTEIIPKPNIVCFDLTSPPGEARRPSSKSPHDKLGCGVQLSGLHIRGTHETGQRGIVFRGHCDEVFCSDLRFQNLAQAITAVELARNGRGFIRESLFRNLVVYSCGTKDLPAMDIRQPESEASQDGNNHLTLRDCSFVWSTNIGLRIADESSKAAGRFVSIDGIMAHGSGDQKKPSGPVISIEGCMSLVSIKGLRGSAYAESFIRVSAIGKHRPQCVRIEGQVTIQSVAVDLRDVDGCIVDLQTLGKELRVVQSKNCTGVEFR